MNNHLKNGVLSLRFVVLAVGRVEFEEGLVLFDETVGDSYFVVRRRLQHWVESSLFFIFVFNRKVIIWKLIFFGFFQSFSRYRIRKGTHKKLGLGLIPRQKTLWNPENMGFISRNNLKCSDLVGFKDFYLNLALKYLLVPIHSGPK